MRSVNACSNAALTLLAAYEFLPRSFEGSCGSSMEKRNGRPGSAHDGFLSLFAKKRPPPRHDTPTSSVSTRRPYNSKKSMSNAPRHPSSAAFPPLSPAQALAVALESCSCKCAITMHSSAYDPIPPLYTSLSARCCKNALSTVTSGRSAGKRRVLARTISALAGPFATSKEMSNWNPLCFSMNLTMGTRALAMSWMSVAMPLRDRLSASALRHVAGALAPLSRITASTSLFGRYMPVAKLPCTSKRAPGQMASTAARTRSTEASRASRSAAVGSRNRQKSTISACRRNIGDRSVFRRSDAPGGHHTGAPS